MSCHAVRVPVPTSFASWLLTQSRPQQQLDAIFQHVECCVACQETANGLRDQQFNSLTVSEDSGPRITRIGRKTNCCTQSIVSVVSRSDRAGSRIAADAGRDLARRLLEGVVRLDRFELRSELGVRFIRICVPGLGSPAGTHRRAESSAGRKPGIAGRSRTIPCVRPVKCSSTKSIPRSSRCTRAARRKTTSGSWSANISTV